MNVLSKIRERLRTYSDPHPLPGKDARSQAEPKPDPAVKPAVSAGRRSTRSHCESAPTHVTPPLPSSPATPLEVLDLPANLCASLIEGGITTVEQLAAASDSEIRDMREVGWYRLVTIRSKLKVYLDEHPRVTQAAPSTGKPKTEPRSKRVSSVQHPKSPELVQKLTLTDAAAYSSPRTPLEVLDLPGDVQSALVGSGVTTVEQMAAKSDSEITQTEIRDKPKAYLAKRSLPAEVERSEGKPRSSVSAKAALAMEEPRPLLRPTMQPKAASIRASSPSSTPLGVLGLSARPYNALRRSGIDTVDQVAAMSHWELLAVRNIGAKSLTEIKDKLKPYLAVHPLRTEPVPSEERPESLLLSVLPETALAPSSSLPLSSPRPLEVLDLSVRSQNALMRSGITTVEQLAAMSDRETWNVLNTGTEPLAEITESLSEIRNKLKACLASPSSSWTPLEVLGLSARSYNTLMRSGIRTVDQLAIRSDEEIKEVRNIGTRSLAEIKGKLTAYLAVRTSPTQTALSEEQSQPSPANETVPSTAKPKPASPPPPLADPAMLDSAREKGIPLDKIAVERLALPASLQSLVGWANIETVGELALQPRDRWKREENIIWRLNFAAPRDPRIVHMWKREENIIRRLNRYLAWLVEQNETAWADEVAGRGINPLHRLELTEMSLEDLTEKWLSSLRSRERQVIRWRYVLDGEKLTLEEVGEHLDVTRERVRQLQNRALRALRCPQSRAVIRPLRSLLISLLEQAGGLMNEAQVEAALRRELTIGNADPVSVARLALDLEPDVKWLGKPKAWGLRSYPLDELKGVQPRLARVLEEECAPLSVGQVVARFKVTHFYHSQRDMLRDDFVIACLRTHPQIDVDDRGMCCLTKWAKRKFDKIVLALRQIGKPVHYSVIAERANGLLPPDQRTLARNIHAILNREPDVFVHLGRGVYWLRRHLVEETGVLPQTDFGDLFGARLERWQRDWERRQGNVELDAQAEVDAIRRIGLDFFSD